MQRSTQHCISLHCTVPHSTGLHCYFTSPCISLNPALHYTLHFTGLCISLPSALHCTLHCTAPLLHYTSQISNALKFSPLSFTALFCPSTKKHRALKNTVQCYTLHCISLHRTALPFHCSPLNYVFLHSIPVHCTLFHCTARHCAAPYFILVNCN